MRSICIVMLVGLFTGVGLVGQAKKAPPKSETFKTQRSMGMGSFEATFTVSEGGYAWISTDGHWGTNKLTPWKDVRRWSCNGEIYGFALTLHQQTGVDDFRFRHADLVTVVNNYLKKYAGDKLDPKEGCNPD